MIQVKTSAKCAGCVAKIAEQLNTFLTPEEKVVEAVRAAGFKAELL